MQINTMALGAPSTNRYCSSDGKMRSASMWLGIAGGQGIGTYFWH